MTVWGSVSLPTPSAVSPKATNHMTTRRRLALLAITLASIAPALSASAQSPQQTDDPDAPPVESEISDEPGAEIVHSWTLAPAGNDETGGGGNRSQLAYVADPGAVLQDAVTLYNLSNVPLVFRIYATDAVASPDGGIDYLGVDDVPTGAGSWVDFGAEQISVDAKTQVTIPITITIPQNTPPGDHIAGLLASNAAVSSGADGQVITLDRRTGTRLVARVNGPLNPELRIENVQTEYDGSLNPLDGSATVTYTVENRGNTLAGATIAASVAGPSGIGRQEIEPIELPEILPGQSTTITAEFDGVPALGVAVGRVELTPSGVNSTEIESTSGQMLTSAIPIVILLGVLALLFGWLAMRAFARHRRSDGDGAAPHSDELTLAELEPEHQST